MKPTAGPWYYREPKHPDLDQIEDRLIVAEVDGEELHIGEVYQYQNHNNKEANGAALANGDLILAARAAATACEELGYDGQSSIEALPDLLTALETVMSDIDNRITCNHYDSFTVARAVTAKARECRE